MTSTKGWIMIKQIQKNTLVKCLKKNSEGLEDNRMMTVVSIDILMMETSEDEENIKGDSSHG